MQQLSSKLWYDFSSNSSFVIYGNIQSRTATFTKQKLEHGYLPDSGGHPLKDLHLLGVGQPRVHGQNSQVFLHPVPGQSPGLLLQERHHLLHLLL